MYKKSSMSTAKCFSSPVREANNGTNSRNNENSSVKTMFLTMQKKGSRVEEGLGGLRQGKGHFFLCDTASSLTASPLGSHKSTICQLPFTDSFLAP